MISTLLCAVALSQARIDAPLPYFEPHSGVWMSLHHVLYELGRRQRVAEGAHLWGPPPFDVGPDLAKLTPDERAVWQRAVDHYARTWADRDLLFDDELTRIKGELAAHEDDEVLSAALPDATLAELNAAVKVYRRVLWPQHDAANRRWVREHAADIAEQGPRVVPMLERAFASPFPSTPIRLDLVPVGSWGGGYTRAESPLHVVLSSLDPRDQGQAGTEILFHETSHGMTDALENQIEAIAKKRAVVNPQGLWHAVLFFTVGEAFRRVWPDYVPYAEARGVYERFGGDYLQALREVWLPRLDADGELSAALEALVDRVNPPDVELQAASEQPVVTGTRTERAAQDAVIATSVITREQIEAIGARDLAQLLLLQPGVELDFGPGGAGVSLQGLGPQYVLVLVDGDRQPGRTGAGVVDLSRWSLRDVERVEIVKGPVAALYGSDAIAGVINLVTRRPARALELAGRVQGGLTGAKPDVLDARANAGTRVGFFEGRAGAGYQSWQPYALGAGSAASGPGQSRWDVDGLLAANLGSIARISGRADWLRRDQVAADVAAGGVLLDRREHLEQLGGTLRLDVQPGRQTHVALWGRAAIFRDELERGGLSQETSIEHLYSVDAQLDTRFGDHAVTAGAQFLAENLLSTRITVTAERYRVGLFAQDEWQVPELIPHLKLTLLPGVRVDVDSQFGAPASPRLALKLDPLPMLTLRASYAWAFRAPSFRELFSGAELLPDGTTVEGNPKLLPESSQSVNVSAEWRPPLPGWRLTASLFHHELSELITVDATKAIDPSSPTRFRYGNVGSAYAQGVEAALRMRVCPGLYLDVAYVFTDARDQVRQTLLEGRAMHQVSAQLELQWRSKGLGLVVRSTWVGPRPFYVDGAQVWTRGFVNLDAQLNWRPFRWGAVFAGVTNAAGAGDAVYVPQPPRRFVGGVQLDY